MLAFVQLRDLQFVFELSGHNLTLLPCCDSDLRSGNMEGNAPRNRQPETGPANEGKRQRLQDQLSGAHRRQALKALLMPAQGRNHFRRMWARQEQSRVSMHEKAMLCCLRRAGSSFKGGSRTRGVLCRSCPQPSQCKFERGCAFCRQISSGVKSRQLRCSTAARRTGQKGGVCGHNSHRQTLPRRRKAMGAHQILLHRSAACVACSECASHVIKCQSICSSL